MHRITSFAVAAVLLAGCSTTSPEVRLAQNQASCEAYGFKAGTSAYANCLMQLDLEAKAEDRASRERIRRGLLAMSASMTPRQPVTCSTFGTANRFGNTAYGNATTTCY